MKAIDKIIWVKAVLMFVCIGSFSDVLLAQNSNLTMITSEQSVEFVDLKKFGVKENYDKIDSYENKEHKPHSTETNASSVKYEFVFFNLETGSISDLRTIEGGLIFLDKEQFKNMGLTLLKGDPNVVFTSDFNIFISDRIARKYYGDEYPIDKRLILDGKYLVLIKGVFKTKKNSLPVEFDFIAGPITHQKINKVRQM
ncbi:ABC transporter permease [Pararhodonellum marinum]|uniref:ABC transporter permease n=1 Tax=Pararhodonellum marinum TaxID=2755358 RepID=UPI00188DFEE3|nr:ABC transporter permease [Pararhodonellum marinum]